MTSSTGRTLFLYLGSSGYDEQ